MQIYGWILRFQNFQRETFATSPFSPKSPWKRGFLSSFVIQSEAKNLVYIHVYVSEILPP